MELIAQTIQSVFEPFTFLMLIAGVATGLVIGVVPGLGGLFGMALLVPLTYQMEPIAAFALLLGMGSVTTTSDTIPAILIGVPGSVGAIATVEDGHPLAKQNQAPRAFGAAYTSSLVGGLFGATVLAMSVPIMQPLILFLKTPDFLAISIAGLFFVSMVSDKNLLKGLAATTVGILVSFVGIDGQTATDRFTFGELYLWDGLPLGVVFLGIFGLPALMDLAARKSIIVPTAKMRSEAVLVGVRDALREWRLVLSCSFMGSLLGAIPGIGLSVIEWVAYGIGKRHRNGGPEFGKGNIRGVIAPESANNAKEGGALIPTIAIGLPGSASMSILLGAFVVHGLVPGPDMLTKDLSITYSMIFFVAMANVLGAVVCLLMTNQLAKIASVPAAIIVPVAMVFVTLGAFQNNVTWIDCAVLVTFGFLGFFMKERGWSRAAFSLGFVLGPSIERYFFLSYQILGNDWVQRPSIIMVAIFALFLVAKTIANWGKTNEKSSVIVANPHNDHWACAVLAIASIWILFEVADMPTGAAIFPQIGAAILGVLSIAIFVQRRSSAVVTDHATKLQIIQFATKKRTELIVGLMPMLLVGLIYLIGYMPAILVFVAGSILFADRKRLRRSAIIGIGCVVVAYTIFDFLISIPWPRPIFGL